MFLFGTDGQVAIFLRSLWYAHIAYRRLFRYPIQCHIWRFTWSAGYFGGRYETIIMCLADVQLIFSILMALLIDGVVRGLISRGA